MMTVTTDGGEGGESTSMTLGDSRAKTDADGLAEIDDVPPGTWDVRITDGRHAPKSLAAQVVTENQVTDLGRIALDPAGRIRGKVLTAEGKAAPMAMVECRRVDSDGEPDRQPAMGGTFTFSGLAPGRYSLRAEAISSEQTTFGEPVEVEVVAQKAPTVVEVTLPGK
jgi:hypothetical protein